jgi:hypothetical protein
MKIDTAIGLIDDSKLAVESERSETAAGLLQTTRYLYGGQVVKIDQRLDVSEAALSAAGFTQL